MSQIYHPPPVRQLWKISAVLIVLMSRATIAADPAPLVHLTIDFNDGSKRVFDLPWKKDLTVKAAMDQAKSVGHGFDYKFIGSGETAKLEKIDDVGNQGGGANKRNWQFWVNSKFADRSFGVYVLNADDTVLWKFDVFRSE